VVVVGCRSRAAPPEASATAPVVLDDAVDRATRDRFRQPDRVIAALGLSPGQRVADVGAGRGYLTFRLARAVGPGGRVVATDIDEAALRALREGGAAHVAGAATVIVRRVEPDDPGLEAGGYDLVLLSEVDHSLRDRVEYLRQLRPALAPGGRLAVTNRRSFRGPLLAAAARAGYTVVGEVTDLPSHFLVFLRPAPP
jgi:predicted methyltransferase